jgi:large subunit ribosomal protein L22
MSQQKNAPRVAENESRAVARFIRSTPRKLNLVAQLIRGKAVARAVADLTFCERRVAGEVKKVLEAAIANAENNAQLDVDRLFVAEATVGKTQSMKRFHARARGRASSVEKLFCNLTIVVRERAEEEEAA